MNGEYMAIAEVFLWGKRAGIVEQAGMSDIPKFYYDHNFLKEGMEISPVMMPLSEQRYTFPLLCKETYKGLPGMLADSLPDKFGTRLIEKYWTEQGRNINEMTAVDRLWFSGNMGMGALEYIPAREYTVWEKCSLDLNELANFISDILRNKEGRFLKGKDRLLEQIINVGTFAGGARAKAVVNWNKQNNDICSSQSDVGDGYECWLVKFDGVAENRDHGNKDDGPAYTRIEYAYYLMALAAGIDMSECSLYKEQGLYHFMTKRFDRHDNGKKLHMQSLGGLAHFDYNNPGEYSYEQAADVLGKICASQMDVERLYRRMVFNVIARNQDDHVKNISFLMDEYGKWTLSPAYDVTYAYDRENHWLAKHQMLINGKSENIARSDLHCCAKYMNISKAEADKVIEDVTLAVKDWERYAEAAFLREEICKGIQKEFVFL